MAKKFQELVKKFDTIRKYTRDFYVYGFKERDEFSYGSQRGYDNERRRIESYLSEWIETEVVYGKKRVRLEIDPHKTTNNPLAQVWQSKSFTKNDIFLHFVLLDIFSDGEKWTIQELVDQIDEEYLFHFNDGYLLDSLTVRKKIKEYTGLGIFQEEKIGRECIYSLVPPLKLDADIRRAISFYKEIFPIGILGEYLLRGQETQVAPFQFKHIFPVQVLDSQVVVELLEAIRTKREVSFKTDRNQFDRFIPVKICSSCESGRQYLIGRVVGKRHLYSIRISFIADVKLGGAAEQFEQVQQQFQKQRSLTWNAAFTSRKTQKLKVYLEIDEEKEQYLIRRLEKEKRMGTVTRTGENEYQFSIAVVDMVALNPFLRTFFGRIKRIQCSNRNWEQQFWKDYQQMYTLYFGGEQDESTVS
ncbi:WYL domain-containing protein [Enterococcus sp. BWR-S5]|uniref:WYL domain-containing protein n=1 Tax=Enterococcus sp. BWR-S5 TaxID=2787714 RepID=UPI001922D847|nr:WYL domain-containing protein [Enterococcus sp. BWR-S5]MBL1223581.1 WYL domain-containing protein [Enterococcus sp. BWR-S5]